MTNENQTDPPPEQFMVMARNLDTLLQGVREARKRRIAAEEAEQHARAIFIQHRDRLLEAHPEFRYGIAVQRVMHHTTEGSRVPGEPHKRPSFD